MKIKLVDLANINSDNAADAGRILQHYCHKASVEAGWWTDIKTGERIVPSREFISEKLMLIVSEVAEAFEAHRKDKQDDHLTNRKGIEVELADAVIRIGDLAGALGLDLGGAIQDKMHYNANRPDHKIANRLADGGKKC